jgi:hypothetical protein
MPECAVVPADLVKDRQVILDLWRRNLADVSQLDEKYDWHFLNNPFGTGQIWLLESNGEPIGTTSLGMRPLKLNKSLTTAGVACDLAVNKDHRFLQPALMLQHALLASARPEVQIVYGVPNSAGSAVMKYVGYQDFCCVHRYAKVLRISHYLQKSGKFGAAIPLIGKMADQGFAALHLFGGQRSRGLTQVLPSFDERFDELWNQITSEQWALTVRNQRFLKWRYQECPLRQYKTLGLLTEDKSRLLGYLIYYIEDHSAVCADFLASGGPEDIDCLLSSWTALAWGCGLSSLSLSCSNGTLAANLLRHGFSRRSAALPRKLGRTKQQEQCKTLFTHERNSTAVPAVANSWYYTEGDSPY